MPTKLNGAGQQQPYTEDGRWNTGEQKTKVITSKKFSNFGKKEAK